MPYHIEDRDGKYYIVRSDTGKVVGKSTSRKKAEASIRARYAGENKSKKKKK